MTCTACTFENHPHDAACRACGTETVPSAGSIVRLESVPGLSYEDRIAEAESRLAALTQHIHAAEAERAAIAQVLAVARRSAGDSRHAHGRSRRSAGDSALPPAPPVRSPGDRSATLDVGTFRLTFGGPHGTRVDSTGRAASVALCGRVVETRWDIPRIDIRPSTPAAVWQAFENGAPAVRIDAAPGAGASTLLRMLAAGAAEHGCPDGARLIANVHGPAIDIGQRLARRSRADDPPRYCSAADLRRDFDGVRVLALLDRARLSAGEQADLVALFPNFRFVIVDGLAVPQTPTFELGALDARAALSLVEAEYGRQLGGEERDAALALCSAAGSLPGSARLIGIVAAELQRSFVSLDADRSVGGDVLRTFIDSLSPTAQCVLTFMALARTTMSSEFIADVVGSDVRGALERLADCEMIRNVAPGTYELAGCLEPFVPAPADMDAAVGRLSAAFCGTFDPRASDDVLDAQLSAAEPIVQRAFERSQWKHVLLLGPRLAEMFAMRGAFGAWGRVLNLVVAAAKRLDDQAALNVARHELGIRALLLGEYQKAATSLRAAACGWERCGDTAGASASSAVLPLVNRALAASDRTLDPPRPAGYAPALRAPAVTAPALQEPIASGPETAVATRPFPAAAKPNGQVPVATEAAGELAEKSEGTPAKAAVAPQAEWAPAAQDEPAAIAQARRAGAAAVAPRKRVPRPTRSRRRESAPVRPVLTGEKLAFFGVAVAVIGLLTILLWPHSKGTPTISEFSANQVEVAGGMETQLCVMAEGATSIEVSPDVGPLPVDGKHCVAVHPLKTTTYTAVAVGSQGKETRYTVTVVLETPVGWPMRIESFSANPARIRAGQSTQLCYAVSGADLLRIVPSVGNLTRLRSCRTVRLLEPRTYRYKLLAIGEHGEVAMRQAHVDVIPAPSLPPAPVAAPSSAPAAVPPPQHDQPSSGHVTAAPGGWLARKAVYQFDATPAVVERGQAASLCVGIGRWARGSVTDIGELEPGINRCYRVHPAVTTVYRLHVALDQSVAVESVTVAVQPPSRQHDVARAQHR